MGNQLRWSGPTARPLERGWSTGQSRPLRRQLRQVTMGRWPKRPYGRAVAGSTDLLQLLRLLFFFLIAKTENVMGHQRHISLQFTILPPVGFDGVGAHGSFTIWPKLEPLDTADRPAWLTGLPHASTCFFSTTFWKRMKKRERKISHKD